MPSASLNVWSVRRAVTEDCARVTTGIDAVCAEGGYFHTDHYVSTPQWEATLYHPETVPNHLLLVAEASDEFVGAIRVFPRTGANGGTPFAELGLFVLPPFRNQGIGSALISQALNWASQQGYTETVLTVRKTNHRAIHTFRKFGFEIQGTCEETDEAGQRAENRWWMKRVVATSQ